MALAQILSGCANGGASQPSVTSPSFSPTNTTDIVIILAGCYASTGDDSSSIAISDTLGSTWNLIEILSQGVDGGGAFPPQPLAAWWTTGSNAARTVTTSVVSGTGFSHFQARYVYSGQDAVTPVADSAAFRADTATASVSLTAPVAGCVGLAIMTDWGNSSDLPVAEAGSTLDCAIVNADIQTSGTVHKDLAASGATTIGFQALAGPLGSLIIGLLIQPAAAGDVEGVLDITLPFPTVDFTGEVTASGVLDITLPVIDAEFDGELTTSGVLDVTLPLIDVDLDGEATAAGTLDITLPVPVVAFDGEVTAAGTLDITLPVIGADFDGDVSVAGQLDLVLPVPDVNLQGQLPVSGVLSIELPLIQAAFQGNSAAGGATMGPCGWTIPDPLCSDTWEAVPADVKAAARDYAALVLWGATGREFGLCEVTVRPCGYRKCGDNLWNFWGYSWASGTWTPYIFNGQWFNCVCPMVCCCDPKCQIRLPGDVEEIVEVLIDGLPVDPDTYFVYDKTWLVRTDTVECWPECPDMNVPNGETGAFEVTYLRGNPVPAALLRAASVLADEWAKACTGGDCRLSNRVTSLARNGIQIEMMDPNDLLDGGLTGLWEVDSVILAINPHRRKQRGQIYAPGRQNPRMQTWP